MAVAGVKSWVSADPAVDGVWDCVVEVEALSVAEPLAAAVAAKGFGLLELTETRNDLEGLFRRLTGQAAA